MVGCPRLSSGGGPTRCSHFWLGLLLLPAPAASVPSCHESKWESPIRGQCLLQRLSSGRRLATLHELAHEAAATGNATAAAGNSTAEDLSPLGETAGNFSAEDLIQTGRGRAAAAQLGCSLPHLALASGVIALLSELAFAALGFGPAIMYEICWQLLYILGVGSGQLEEAVWNSLVMSSAVAVVQAFWLRRHLNVRVAALMTLPLLAGLPLGTLVLEWYGRQPWVKRLLGGIFLVMVCIQHAGVTGPKRRIEDLSLRTCTWVSLAALVGGLSRGLFGVSAPVSLLLLFFSLDRELWRLLNALFRIVIFLVQGSMLATHLEVKTGCVLMYTTLVVGGMLGMLIGNSVAPHLSSSDMQRWLSFFLTAAGLLMIGDGFHELEIAATILSFLALIVTLVVAVCSKRKEEEPVEASSRKALATEYGPASCTTGSRG